jgi:hypothetical protein
MTDTPKLASELMAFAAALARGEYHPSDHVEDYRKGMGRREFAEMAGDCADRVRAKVSLLKRAAEALAAEARALHQALIERGALKAKVERLRDELEHVEATEAGVAARAALRAFREGSDAE